MRQYIYVIYRRYKKEKWYWICKLDSKKKAISTLRRLREVLPSYEHKLIRYMSIENFK